MMIAACQLTSQEAFVNSTVMAHRHQRALSRLHSAVYAPRALRRFALVVRPHRYAQDPRDNAACLQPSHCLHLLSLTSESQLQAEPVRSAIDRQKQAELGAYVSA